MTRWNKLNTSSKHATLDIGGRQINRSRITTDHQYLPPVVIILYIQSVKYFTKCYIFSVTTVTVTTAMATTKRANDTRTENTKCWNEVHRNVEAEFSVEIRSIAMLKLNSVCNYECLNKVEAEFNVNMSAEIRSTAMLTVISV